MTTIPSALRGKTAVVTGASSGIGAQIAREMHAAGANVLLVGRDESRLDSCARSISGDRDAVGHLSVDVTGASAPDEIVDHAVTKFGGIDVLVNAAGIFTPTPFGETTDQILDEQWNVNVRAPFRLARTAVTRMNEGASIIFVSSICGYAGFPNSSAYCATKGAVELLVKALTAELSPAASASTRSRRATSGPVSTRTSSRTWRTSGRCSTRRRPDVSARFRT